MNYIKSFIFLLFIYCMPAKVNAQFITIDDQRTPQYLIENVLINSSCALASNATGSGDTFRAGKQSFAYFNGNGSSFPFNEGIVLVTSTAQSAIGPFASELVSSDNPNWGGDNELDQMLGIKSVNATILEFDFVATANLLSFNYIFASNEYQYDYPCEYSDGFAFLIKKANDPSDPYKNLAIIPNSSTPVSSTEIRPTIIPGNDPNNKPYTGCPAQNQNYFEGFNNNFSPVNFAAQTKVMTAQSNVVAGEKYHIKLVIADDRNRNLESAIFLESGSFTIKIDLGKDRTTATNNPACFGEKILLDTGLQNTDYNFKWYNINTPATILGTNSTFDVVEAGNYKVEATANGTACILSGEIKVEYAPEILSTNTSLLQCDDNADGISIFDLNKVNNIVKNNVANISNEGYYETLNDAQTKINKIATPANYINKSNPQTVYARLENIFGCYKTVEVILQISNTSIADPNPISTCDGDNVQDGLYHSI